MCASRVAGRERSPQRDKGTAAKGVLEAFDDGLVVWPFCDAIDDQPVVLAPRHAVSQIDLTKREALLTDLGSQFVTWPFDPEQSPLNLKRNEVGSTPRVAQPSLENAMQIQYQSSSRLGRWGKAACVAIGICAAVAAYGYNLKSADADRNAAASFRSILSEADGQDSVSAFNRDERRRLAAASVALVRADLPAHSPRTNLPSKVPVPPLRFALRTAVAAMPPGVDRFDVCLPKCETRDPQIVGRSGAQGLEPGPKAIGTEVQETVARSAAPGSGHSLLRTAANVPGMALTTGKRVFNGLVDAIR